MVYSQLQKGTLLISSPDSEMGLFFRSVLLICEHSPNGSFGLVINKRLELELPEEIVNIHNLSNPNVNILAGGPVQTNQLMLLHTNGDVANTLDICEGVYLGGDLQFLQDALAHEHGPAIDLCFGYAGWGAGQLEREFLDGGWFLTPASQRVVFHISPEKMWSTLLREMGGRYASLSMIPEDLSVN